VKVRLVHVTTRLSGRKSRREESREAESLRIGRGTDNDLELSGLTVALHHAALHERGGRFFLEGVEGNSVRIGAKVSEGGGVAAGDVVRIGGYELRIVAPEGDEDLALEVEEIEQRGTEREELARKTAVGVNRGLFTQRKLAWGLGLGVLVLFGALPLATGRFESSWSSGPISSNHAFIAKDCGKCHRGGFELVRDAECLACHTRIGSHAPPDVELASLDEARCAGCHIEHNGRAGLARLEQRFCTDCHAQLAQLVSTTQVENASCFAKDHPQFRIALVTDAGAGAVERVRWSPQLEERSGLLFDHLRHVGRNVAEKTTGEERQLRCGECHQPDAAGKTMAPIVFERHCQKCHSIDFDPAAGERQAWHGDPVRMRRELREYYSFVALEGAAAAPAPSPLLRRKAPSQELSAPEREASVAWVEEQVARADAFLMQEKARCRLCHVLAQGSASDGGTGILPVKVAQVWMPKAAFDHSTHEPFACRECHGAAAVQDPGSAPGAQRPDWAAEDAVPYALYTPEALRTEHGLAPSEKSSDVLVPGIEACQRCHGGADARPPLVASDCALCHPFHRREHGAMHARAPRGAEHAALADGHVFPGGGGSR
jgi:hypothetical protein